MTKDIREEILELKFEILDLVDEINILKFKRAELMDIVSNLKLLKTQVNTLMNEIDDPIDILLDYEYENIYRLHPFKYNTAVDEFAIENDDFSEDFDDDCDDDDLEYSYLLDDYDDDGDYYGEFDEDDDFYSESYRNDSHSGVMTYDDVITCSKDKNPEFSDYMRIEDEQFNNDDDEYYENSMRARKSLKSFIEKAIDEYLDKEESYDDILKYSKKRNRQFKNYMDIAKDQESSTDDNEYFEAVINIPRDEKTVEDFIEEQIEEYVDNGETYDDIVEGEDIQKKPIDEYMEIVDDIEDDGDIDFYDTNINDDENDISPIEKSIEEYMDKNDK